MDKALPADGGNHPDALLAKIRRANDLDRQGRIQAARVLYEDVLTRSREHLDEDQFRDRATAAALNLQGVLRRQGDSAAAVALLEDLLARLWRAVGDDNVESLIAEHNLAVIVRAGGNLPRARELAAASLQRRRRVFGDDHQHTASSRQFLEETIAWDS
ncbi:tetratricopeptide repeat protein [Frankia sp. CNm7]|uniref:Tetratricopeptide repeat protein n=1 Tax=Frankia nepalensis TaxID=1836974 RepID=A0A937UQC7_9ACTN|nr:tetratricopeptide repeat protein [Frankia nepalensis]MBL7502644.1 tetratricopeptide repeat protein [Frankia nepalensis]MBL7514856.1 tetratricopeptide repeat protein [Frankia nepalensis]MBL7520875.1 tetratricopeptide repeat protein [Frankia nepalensis]MBL7626536.1 tetratricopeptide repeat protein [Frankia nepalensis]